MSLRHTLYALLIVALLLPVPPAGAQNPFLQNRGKRTVERVEFVGNEITRDYVLQRTFRIEAGDEYDPERVGEAWERLEALDFIAYVEIETIRPDPTRVELVVRVEEDTRFRWAPGLEYSRRYGESFLGTLRLGWLNLTGRAESVDLEVSAWSRRGARIVWQNPWIFGPARLGVFVAAHWQQYEWEYELGAIDPRDEFTDWGASAGVWRAFDPWVTVRARVGWRELELEGAGIDQDPAVALGLVHDSRDVRYYPGHGLHGRGELLRGGMSNGVEDYTIGSISLSAFRTLPLVATVLGVNGAFRATDTALPFYQKVYLGGPMSLRGVDFGSLVGDEAWRASVELRRPLLLLPLREGRTIGVGVHAFHDRGTSWAHDADLADQQVRFSSGLGLHFNFNTRNFRFEWARTDDGEDVFVFEDTFTF